MTTGPTYSQYSLVTHKCIHTYMCVCVVGQWIFGIYPIHLITIFLINLMQLQPNTLWIYNVLWEPQQNTIITNANITWIGQISIFIYIDTEYIKCLYMYIHSNICTYIFMKLMYTYDYQIIYKFNMVSFAYMVF